MSLLSRLREDITSARVHDPAARGSLEIVLGYSGLHAIWAHRVNARLWRRGFRLPARLGSQFARFLTGIEIHPGATIGRRFFIDHGMGVVFGDDVMLYHGVTLGGKSRGRGKRHPTLGDGVQVGAGAKILGPILVGHGSIVGANAVVTRDSPPDSLLMGVPATARPRGTAASHGLPTPEYLI